MSKRKQDFLREFKELLKKYNAEFDVRVYSEGFYECDIDIDFRGDYDKIPFETLQLPNNIKPE